MCPEHGRLLHRLGGNSHAGPDIGQDEERDILECVWWVQFERASKQKRGVEADVGGGCKEENGDPIKWLLSSVSSVPGCSDADWRVDTHDDRCHRPIFDDLCEKLAGVVVNGWVRPVDCTPGWIRCCS
jgi:hypothetical protein